MKDGPCAGVTSIVWFEGKLILAPEMSHRLPGALRSTLGTADAEKIRRGSNVKASIFLKLSEMLDRTGGGFQLPRGAFISVREMKRK